MDCKNIVKERRIEAFEKLGFGVFVHFGLYSQLGRGEWAAFLEKMESADYAKLKDSFVVRDDFAENLVLTAKRCGARYITFTTRHHDGFSLYDTQGLNDFDAPHSACRRDIVREFTDACNKHGIVPFFYHTTLDWSQESFENDFPAYQKYLRDSVEILCTRYGKIGGFWFDGNWGRPEAEWEEDALYSLIRKYQKDAIIINNSGLSALGEARHHEIDVLTFERNSPESRIQKDGKYRASEMCEVNAAHWGYAVNDINFKSMREILNSLMLCKKSGANFLFNIGPKGDGSIDLKEEVFLTEIGKWMNVYGSAFFGTTPVTQNETQDFIVGGSSGEKYIFVYGLGVSGDSNVVLNDEGIKSVKFDDICFDITKVEWMDNGEKLNFRREGNRLIVDATNFRYGCDLIWRVAKIT